MRRESLAAIAFAFLIALCASPQEFPGNSQRGIPPEQSSAPQASSTRTPREDEELRADLLMARKQYPEAILVYQKLLQTEPRNAVLLNKIGIAYHQQAMLDQAKRYYERAVRANKNYAAGYNNLGTVLYDRRKFRQAVQQYKRALAVDPGMATAYRNMGSAYLAEKKYDEAFAAYQRAVGLDPQVFEGHSGFGTVLQHMGVEDKGLFYFFLAKSFATMGNAERCAHYLRKAKDEGYKNLAAAQSDPAFASVLRDPSIQQILQASPPVEDKPRSPAPTPPGDSL